MFSVVLICISMYLQCIHVKKKVELTLRGSAAARLVGQVHCSWHDRHVCLVQAAVRLCQLA